MSPFEEHGFCWDAVDTCMKIFYTEYCVIKQHNALFGTCSSCRYESYENILKEKYTTRDFGLFIATIWTLMNHQWYQGIFFGSVKLCFVKYQQLTRWSEHNYVSFRCCLSVRRKEGTVNHLHVGPFYRTSRSEKLSNTIQSFKSRGDESKSDVGIAREIT